MAGWRTFQRGHASLPAAFPSPVSRTWKRPVAGLGALVSVALLALLFAGLEPPPQAPEARLTVQGGIGTDDYYRGTVDANIRASELIACRLNAMAPAAPAEAHGHGAHKH